MEPTREHKATRTGMASKGVDEGNTWGVGDAGLDQRDSGSQGTSPRAMEAAGDGTQGIGQSQKRGLRSMDEEE